MKKIVFNTLLLLLGIHALSCQKDRKRSPEERIPEISGKVLKHYTQTLSSDHFEGRGSGYKGERLAAEYIAGQFQRIGLSPIQGRDTLTSYLQEFKFHTLGSKLPWEVAQTQNVMGVLKSDVHPNEYIVIGGHHDGQGMEGQANLGRDIPEGFATDSIAAAKDTIWNSAVDNAVSVSAIIAMADFLKNSGTKLNRSIIFTTFSAEEVGLNGSTHFVNRPPVPLGQIKAMVNLEKIVGDPEAEFLYVSYGTNPIFEKIRKRIEGTQALKMTPFYPGMIANSDHYAFAQRKIPTVTIGTGSRINVGTPLDTGDRLDYATHQARTKYILEFLVELANAETNFDFHGDLQGLYGISGGKATEAEKQLRGFTGEVGFKITAVVKDSKGQRLGFEEGDLVISINGAPIKNQIFYQGLEDVMDDITDTTGAKSKVLRILRDKQQMDITIPLE